MPTNLQIYIPYHTIHISNISRIYSCTFRAATNLLLTNQSASSMEYAIKQEQQQRRVCTWHVHINWSCTLFQQRQTEQTHFSIKENVLENCVCPRERERETSKSLTFLFKFNCIVYIFISVYLAAVKWLISGTESSGIRYKKSRRYIYYLSCSSISICRCSKFTNFSN